MAREPTMFHDAHKLRFQSGHATLGEPKTTTACLADTEFSRKTDRQIWQSG